MRQFLDEDFLLQSNVAQSLYHNHSKDLPIIDYHCHLDPKLIAENYQFKSITELWLGGDHYKWRLMRANGVDEEFITGNATDWEKFKKFAETIPYTMRNPMYHWTHMELQRVFGIKKLLSSHTATEIYEECNKLLQDDDFTTQELMKKFNVEVVCTTDDPCDSLIYHKQIKKSNFEIKVLPTWRPDKLMSVESGQSFRKYVERLEKAANISISDFNSFLDAIKKRHDYFSTIGCTLADHGINTFYSHKCSDKEACDIFNKIYVDSKELTELEIIKFKSKILNFNASLNHEKNWVQQFHFGAIRNNNTRMLETVGPDTGYDSIMDNSGLAISMSRFFDRLHLKKKLTKTIVYNLNPRDNYLVATMLANFQEAPFIAKMQFGSGWWFLDQKEGMEDQMNVLSSQGLLSRFVGMLTDSRSFISYPRHEYFRRIMCNLIGNDIKNGLLPSSELSFIGKMVEGISYYNAKTYFGF